jgi:hypothetical protein
MKMLNMARVFAKYDRMETTTQNRNKLTTKVVYMVYTMYICCTYCNIKTAAGLSAGLKIKAKNIDKELSRLVDSSYFFILSFLKKIKQYGL